MSTDLSRTSSSTTTKTVIAKRVVKGTPATGKTLTYTSVEEDCKRVAKIVRESTDKRGAYSKDIFGAVESKSSAFKVALKAKFLVEASVSGYYRSTKAMTKDIIGEVFAETLRKQIVANNKTRQRKNSTTTTETVDGVTTKFLVIPFDKL